MHPRTFSFYETILAIGYPDFRSDVLFAWPVSNFSSLSGRQRMIHMECNTSESITPFIMKKLSLSGVYHFFWNFF